MISDRAPVCSEQADRVLDEYLDGKWRRKKRDQRLRAIVATLPPKTCGCTNCSRLEVVTERVSQFMEAMDEEGGEHG